MKNKWMLLVVSLILVVVVLPIASSCTPQAKPTPTPATPTVQKPKELNLHCMIDLSGPVAAMTKFVIWPFIDVANWTNKNEGGIDGVPVKIVWHDTRYDNQIAVSEFMKLREEKPKPPIIVVLHAPHVDALAQRCKEDQIVMVCSSTSQKAIWPPSWVWCFSGSLSDYSAALFDWLSADWAKSGKTEKCRVAFFNPQNAYGVAITSPEAMEYAKTKSNIEIVSTDFFDEKALDLSSDIIRVMQNKPDWIFGYYYGGYGAAFYKSLDASGYTGKVKIGSYLWCMQTETVDQVGPKVVEGVTGPLWLPPWKKAGPQISPAMEWMNQVYLDGVRPKDLAYAGTSYEAGFCGALGVMSMMKQTIAEVGWDKFTGDAIYKKASNITSIDLKGITTWGMAPGVRSNTVYNILQFKDGFPAPVTGWLTAPDVRPKEFRTAEYGWKGVGWPTGYFK